MNNNDTPAFPIERMTAHGILAHAGLPEGEAAYIAALARMTAGMTLRDYFAAKAMQAVTTNKRGFTRFTWGDRAEWAYKQADAMLAMREVVDAEFRDPGVDGPPTKGA